MNFTEVLCPTGFCYTFNLPDQIENFYNFNELSNDFNFTNYFRVDTKSLPKDAWEYRKSVNYPVKVPSIEKGLLRALLRYQPFKLVDFLSYVGGILGLFAGISVLSIVEVFYYFTIRILIDVWRYFKGI